MSVTEWLRQTWYAFAVSMFVAGLFALAHEEPLMALGWFAAGALLLALRPDVREDGD